VASLRILIAFIQDVTFIFHWPHHHEGSGELADGVERVGHNGDLDLALRRLEVVGHQVARADVLGRLEYSNYNIT